MPFEIRHTPVGLLGQLAVRAGQVRGQQIRMGRDIQLTNMLLAMQERGADVASRRAERAFALQRAGATQAMRQRPATPEVISQRKNLQKVVSEAKAANIYEPAQIKQMQIFADLGDEKSLRVSLGKLPQKSLRRLELQKQSEAVTEIGKGTIGELQKQFDIITDQLKDRFAPDMQQIIIERPELMKTVSPEVQEALAQKQQLKEQMVSVANRTAKMQQMIQLGIAVPEQMALEARQERELLRQEEVAYQRSVQQTRGVGGLTDQEELAIDVVRDEYRDRRKAIDRQIALIAKDLGPFEDESEADHAERIGPIREQIRLFGLQKMALHAREKQDIGNFLSRGDKGRKPKLIKGTIYTNAAGQRARFIGYDEDGRPLMDIVE